MNHLLISLVCHHSVQTAAVTFLLSVQMFEMFLQSHFCQQLVSTDSPNNHLGDIVLRTRHIKLSQDSQLQLCTNTEICICVLSIRIIQLCVYCMYLWIRSLISSPTVSQKVDVNISFWQGRRMCGLKKNMHWRKETSPLFVRQCDRSAMLF